MKTTISDTQAAFFTKNGFIEFEIAHQIPKSTFDRDQFREDHELKSFIEKVLGPISLHLTGKKQLRIGTSEWIYSENRPNKLLAMKEMVSIQNLAIVISMASQPSKALKRSSLGILPQPTNPVQILFFRPDLLLDWPHVTSDLFLILLALPNAVYVHNTNDPKTTYLKKLGYEYGDSLKNETHPLLFSK